MVPTEVLARLMVLPPGVASHPLDEELEGLAATPVRYLELDALPHAALLPLHVGLFRKLLMRIALEARAVPKRLGLGSSTSPTPSRRSCSSG